MDNFNCCLKTYAKLTRCAINFNNVAMVHLEINFEDLYTQDWFEYALVNADELIKSIEKSSSYQVITSINGITEEGGWEGVDVKHTIDRIEWTFEGYPEDYYFSFDREDYIEQIQELRNQIQNLKSFTLKPNNVIFS